MAQTPPLDFTVHWVLIKAWKEEKLQPKWEEPFLVLLTTETAVRTREKGWMHYIRVKGPVEEPTIWTVQQTEDPL